MIMESKNMIDDAHVKVPDLSTPYGKAKHLQLLEKDPDGAIEAFKGAIEAGDRVDSALKDMAVVLKQQKRPRDAINAITFYRHFCSPQAHDSLDNLLIDLYKKCGMVEEQITLLKQKLRLIHEGAGFNGRRTKTARSHGRKFQVSVVKETTRLLSNLGWAYLQQSNYTAAEVVYRKAQEMDADDNKACNLAVCLLRQGRLEEAKSVAEGVLNKGGMTERKMVERAKQILDEIMQSWRIEEEEREFDMAIQLGNMMMMPPKRKRSRLRVFREMTAVTEEVAY